MLHIEASGESLEGEWVDGTLPEGVYRWPDGATRNRLSLTIENPKDECELVVCCIKLLPAMSPPMKLAGFETDWSN